MPARRSSRFRPTNSAMQGQLGRIAVPSKRGNDPRITNESPVQHMFSGHFRQSRCAITAISSYHFAEKVLRTIALAITLLDLSAKDTEITISSTRVIGPNLIALSIFCGRNMRDSKISNPTLLLWNVPNHAITRHQNDEWSHANPSIHPKYLILARCGSKGRNCAQNR
jgi:hypothetical protein